MWRGLKYFSEKENWGDPAKIDQELLERLDAWRGFIGMQVIITSGTQGVHTPNSQHYLGKAVDVIVPGWTQALLDLYFSAERFGFHGIGVYKDWKFLGKNIGGLHLDMRQLDATPKGLQEARWIGISDQGIKYHPLSYSHLKKFRLI